MRRKCVRVGRTGVVEQHADACTCREAESKAKPEQSKAGARQLCCAGEVLPPLLAGEGWGGVALCFKDQKRHPLPTSPCKQGEEQSRNRSRSRSSTALYASPLSSLHSSGLPSRAHNARRFTRGPCAAVRWGTTGPQGSRQGCRLLFARTGFLSKARPQLPDLPGKDARQAPSGVAFSLGYFSLGRGQAREK